MVSPGESDVTVIWGREEDTRKWDRLRKRDGTRERVDRVTYLLAQVSTQVTALRRVCMCDTVYHVIVVAVISFFNEDINVSASDTNCCCGGDRESLSPDLFR